MKIAIMQPYIFPYIGYFQLIHSVDKFVFYDDVNFIKRGWINRNSILVNGSSKKIAIPCKKVSQNKLIKDIEIDKDNNDFNSLLKTVAYTYKKAPFFNQVFPLVERTLNSSVSTISELAIESVITISYYLKLKTEFKKSSEDYISTQGLDKADRLIAIAKQEECSTYINSIGGNKLYEKEYFSNKGVGLMFLESNIIKYNQLGNDFKPWLSIIDVLMFNSIEEINIILKEYKIS